VPFFPAVRNSKIYTIRPFLLDCTLPRFLCLLFLLYDLLNPYSMACLQYCPCCLDFCASLLPWDACPSSQKWLLSCCSKMLSLLLSQNESTTQEWVRPSTLIDLMREGEEFSNPMAEIRLDEWLRLNVSSLTLTLVIKSPFNLHLTN
jgi:hypothetical protein